MTLVIAAATCVNVWVAWGQWSVGAISATAAQTAAGAAKSASDTAAKQYIEMQAQTKALAEQTEFARRGIEDARRTLISLQRPIVIASAQSSEGSGFPESLETSPHVSLKIDISNDGNQIAIINKIVAAFFYGSNAGGIPKFVRSNSNDAGGSGYVSTKQIFVLPNSRAEPDISLNTIVFPNATADSKFTVSLYISYTDPLKIRRGVTMLLTFSKDAGFTPDFYDDVLEPD